MKASSNIGTAPRVAPTLVFMSAPLSKPGSSLPLTSEFWGEAEVCNPGADMDGNVYAAREYSSTIK